MLDASPRWMSARPRLTQVGGHTIEGEKNGSMGSGTGESRDPDGRRRREGNGQCDGRGKALAAILIGLVGSDDKVLQQSEGGNRVLERGVSLGGRAVSCGRFRAEREPGERNLPDARLGHGSDEVHANLPQWCGGMDGSGVVAVEGRQHGRPVGGDGDRRVERVRERSPPRDDFAHHDRGEWRLAEGHRQSHSEISGAFLLVLNWRPSDPVDDVELDHTDSTTWRGTEPRSRRAWPERSTFWAPVSEEPGRNMPQQLLRAPS